MEPATRPRIDRHRWALIAALGAVLEVGLVACGPGMGSIGAILTKQHSDGRMMVRQVPADMESAKAGLQPGDEVLYIDSHDVRAMSADEVHKMLVGAVGTTVDVTIVRAGKVLRLVVKRGPLK